MEKLCWDYLLTLPTLSSLVGACEAAGCDEGVRWEFRFDSAQYSSSTSLHMSEGTELGFTAFMREEPKGALALPPPISIWMSPWSSSSAP